MVEGYFNERTNPSVKKYKSVVTEYFKKYTSEIKEQSYQPKTEQLFIDLKKFMQRNIENMGSDEDLLICYWMVELSGITRETSK